MKRELFGIFVFVFFMLGTTISLATNITLLSPGVVDQSQDITTNVDWLEGGMIHYQEFVNQGNILEEIQLHMGCYFSGSYPMDISIEKPIGTKLSTVTYTANLFPLDQINWMTVNLPDVKLKRGEKYFIVVEFDIGSEYAWSGAFGDPYPAGGSSKAPDWDYAFRTIVDKSKPKNIETTSETFLSCYIETKLYGSYEKTDAKPEFGFLLYMPENENRETAIYSGKNGDVLWNTKETMI